MAEQNGNVRKLRPNEFEYSEEFLRKLRALFPGYEDFELLLQAAPQVIGISLLDFVEATESTLSSGEADTLRGSPEGAATLRLRRKWCEDGRKLYEMWQREVGV